MYCGCKVNWTSASGAALCDLVSIPKKPLITKVTTLWLNYILPCLLMLHQALSHASFNQNQCTVHLHAMDLSTLVSSILTSTLVLPR